MVDFLRKYKLEVTASTGESRVFTDLQIEFTVTKVADSDINTMSLALYNVSEATKGLLKYDKDTVVTLQTAYRNGTWTKTSDDSPLELLFQGTVFNMQTVRSGANVVTNIECKDGNVPLREARASSQWPEGVTVRQIVTNLVEKHFIGVSIGEIFGDALDHKFQNGYSARGPVRKVLDNLAKANQLQWNITDGVFNMFPKNKTLEETTLIISNVLGTVEPLFQEPNQLKNATELPNPDGVKFRQLLNPKFKPGKKLEVDSKNIKGDYKTEKVTHKGAYRGNLWESQIEAVKVD